MKFSEFFKSKDTTQLDKKTLVILRWMAIVGQYITIGIVYFIFNFDFPFYFCSAAVLIGAITNFLESKIIYNPIFVISFI